MGVKSNKIKSRKDDSVFDICVTLVMLLILLAVAYPIIIIVSSSFSSANSLLTGKVRFLPVEPTLEGYKSALGYSKLWLGMRNSAVYTVLGVLISMFSSILAAYPLSRKDLDGNKFISLLFVFTMWFSGGLIPTYLVVKNLHIMNSVFAMILPSAVNVFNVIVLRTYFESLPPSLREAALLDGSDDFRYLFTIAVPLSKASIAVVAMYYAVSQWNIFMNAYLYIQDNKLQPIQVILRDIILMSETQEMESMGQQSSVSNAELLKYTSVVVSSIPVILIYPLVQKHFVNGIMVGAVKG